MTAVPRGFRTFRLAMALWLLSAGTTTRAGAEWDDYFPDTTWRTSTPEEQGVDSRDLANLVRSLANQTPGVHSLLVIRHGYGLAEAYFYPSRKEYLHSLYSCTKSITSTLVGMAISDGKLEGIDQTVVSLFPEKTFSNIDERKRSITIRHLLTHSSGLDWEEQYFVDSELPLMRFWEKSPDKVQFLLDRKMIDRPGTRFVYNTAGSHLLAAVSQRVVGVPLAEYARTRLFEPLGIKDFVWLSDAQQISMGGYGLFLYPTDMAKVGYLFLRKGRWSDRRLLDEKWIRESTQRQIDTRKYGYGFQWWIDESVGAYYALGYGGQVIGVVPEKDLVVVMTSKMSSPAMDQALLLLSGFARTIDKDRQTLAPNPKEDRELIDLVRGVAGPPPDRQPPTAGSTARAVSGKWYRLSGAAFEGYDRLSLTFSGKDAELRLAGPSGVTVLFYVCSHPTNFASPLGEFWSYSSKSRHGSLSGFWTGAQHYEVLVHDLLNSESQQWTFSFRDRTVDIVRKSLSDSSSTWTGTGKMEE